MRCGERWGLCHSQSKPCVQEVEGYCCKRHFPQKRPLPMAVKSIQLEKGLQRIQKKSILSCIPYESVWDVTDGTKTCWASEGREKARRWRSINNSDDGDAGHPGYCTQFCAIRCGNYWDPFESDWEPANEAEAGNEGEPANEAQPGNEADEAID